MNRFGNLRTGHIGGLKFGRIGAIPYSNMNGIYSNSFLGAQNPNAADDETSIDEQAFVQQPNAEFDDEVHQFGSDDSQYYVAAPYPYYVEVDLDQPNPYNVDVAQPNPYCIDDNTNVSNLKLRLI